MDRYPPQVTRPTQPLSTGSLRLDLACGGGVFPGELVEISGPPESGKSTLALRLAAEAAVASESCAWIDADWSFDPRYASRFCSGACAEVARSSLLIARPSDVKSALDMLCILADAGPRLIIIDSLSTLISREFPDGSAGDDEGQETRLLSLALRKVAPQLRRLGTSLIFIHQTPAEFNGQSARAISAAYHGLGRRLERLSLDLHTSLTLRIEASRPIQQNEGVPGLNVRAQIIRVRRQSLNDNTIKIFPCFRRVDFDIMYKQGLIRTGEVFDLGVETGSILFREGRYFFQNQELGLGRAVAILAMERRSLTLEVVQVIRQTTLRNSVEETGDRAVPRP